MQDPSMDIRNDLTSKSSPELRDIEVRRTELGYVTSVDISRRTFFAQFCKFTNAELIEANKAIHNYCKKIITNGLTGSYNPKTVRVGQIYCARYNVDNNWYRVEIIKVNPDNKVCEGAFVDYGNTHEFQLTDLLRVNPSELPCIERAPFGVNMIMKDSDKLDKPSAKVMLNALLDEYILIRALEQKGPRKWLVDLPKVAYNSAFWLNYHKERKLMSTGQEKPLDDGEVNQELLTREEMLAAGLSA